MVYQIDEISKDVTKEDLYDYLLKEDTNPTKKIKTTKVGKDINKYLIDKKAEKCIIFSDFDAIDEVIDLSKKVEVYWMCFRRDFYKAIQKGFNGYITQTLDEKDIIQALEKFNSKNYKTLVYEQHEEYNKNKTSYSSSYYDDSDYDDDDYYY